MRVPRPPPPPPPPPSPPPLPFASLKPATELGWDVVAAGADLGTELGVDFDVQPPSAPPRVESAGAAPVQLTRRAVVLSPPPSGHLDSPTHINRAQHSSRSPPTAAPAEAVQPAPRRSTPERRRTLAVPVGGGAMTHPSGGGESRLYAGSTLHTTPPLSGSKTDLKQAAAAPLAAAARVHVASQALVLRGMSLFMLAALCLLTILSMLNVLSSLRAWRDW